jgi:hypothetical protein
VSAECQLFTRWSFSRQRLSRKLHEDSFRREERRGEMSEGSYYQIANRRGEVVGRIKRDEINTSSIHQKESLTAILSVNERRVNG